MIQTLIIIFAVFFAVMIAAVIIGLCVVAKRNTPASKGDFGENAVAKALGGTITGKQYLVNDLLFEVSGHSCQIDHVFINHNGVWVIETKNYAGVIYGNENEREWTQALGATVHKHQNPIKQNRTHIYRLKEYLNTDDYFFNAVVFLDRADLTNIQSDCVFSVDELQIIKDRDTGITLSSDQMEFYYGKLTELKNSNTVTKAEHIENIHKIQQRIENKICPHCGVKLVPRTGRNGDFYGCPNYPTCTFTLDKE